jgi:hypothetical protein
MNKYIQYILVAIALIWLAYFLNDKHGFVKFSKEITKSEQVAYGSLKIDSINSLSVNRSNAKYDSIIIVKNHSDSIALLQINALYANYKQLRLIAKSLQVVKIDSLNQVVDGIPAVAFNAEINSGNKCDSLINLKDTSIRMRDSIIRMRIIEYLSEKKLNSEKDSTIQDFVTLSKLEKEDLAKAKKLNKNIPLIAGLSAVGALVLRLLLLK